jgi:hypothetical protein
VVSVADQRPKFGLMLTALAALASAVVDYGLRTIISRVLVTVTAALAALELDAAVVLAVVAAN